MRIDEVEGISSGYAQKLSAAGVSTTDDLLDKGSKPSGRDRLAETTGISGKLILEWVNHVDLMRIPGVGSEYSDLLEAAGVDSPLELARRNAASLATTIKDVDAAQPNLVRRVPSEETVAGWIESAGKLDRIVEH